MYKVVPFFERYHLHAIKRADYDLWKHAVVIFHKNHLKGLRQNIWDKKDVAELMGIKKDMELYKGGNRHAWKWLK